MSRNQEPIHARIRTNQHITHISTLESYLELNEGFIYLSQWQNHIDEDMEQQQQVGMQLG
jgi:hypothetical protein